MLVRLTRLKSQRMPQERTKLIGALKVCALISHLRGRIHGSKRKREIFFIESLGSGAEMKSKQVWVGGVVL